MSENTFVLDTNIWVSYIISGKIEHLVAVALTKQFTFLTCENLIEELEDVLNRRKFRKYISTEYVIEAIIIHKKISKYFYIENPPSIVRDKKDDYLIELCKVGNASFIVSEDKDIQVLLSKIPYKILSLSEFRKLITK
ncbi:MAG: putative toxin-antitoxin system toxin component, PIN family [Bacteroidia bacterium]